MVVLNNPTDASIWIRQSNVGDVSVPLPFSGINDWFTIRYEVTPDTFKIFYNAVVVYAARRVDGYVATLLEPTALWLEQGRQKKIDYYRIYGADFSTPIYAEEFSSAANMAWPNPAALTPIPTCDNAWQTFFNSKRGTYFSLSQIEAEYRTNCGYYAQPCQSAPALMLCGLSLPPNPPNPPADSACADVTQLGLEKGRLAWKYYVDSTNAEFDRLYLAKCLAGTSGERLTVSHPVSEYHYTLYYYDRAGNLVKTVPPAGVKTDYSTTWLNGVKAARAAATAQPQIHTLATQYRYNSLNQVVAQSTPDADQSRFWYDRLGRLALSQNAKQAAASPMAYSYTRYDALGRVAEVGQKQNAAVVNQSLTRSQTNLNNFVYHPSTPNTQATITVYDLLPQYNMTNAPAAFINQQKAYTTRNRVSYSLLYDSYTGTVPNPTAYAMATYYNYDIHGNVKQLMHHYATAPMATAYTTHQYKFMAYQYDLISGKVNSVAYNPGYADQFYHRYTYDAENRLTDVYTTTNPMFVGRAVLEDHE
ncbi:MAG: hypothetical protein EAY75_01120, partial [Bacteroidetes bacterium]